MSQQKDLHAELQTLQDTYAAELPQRLESIAACWERLCQQFGEHEPLQQLYLQIHKLAGSGSTFGFHNLSEQAGHIEQDLKAWLETGIAPDEAKRQSIGLRLSRLDERAPPPLIQEVAPAPRPSEVTAESVRVYLLEDDPRLAESQALQLSHFGYQVDSFADSAALERAIDRRCPDILIIDIVLAEGDLAGIQAAKRVQERHGRELPIIVQSNREDFAARHGAVHAGVSAYLVKPVDIDLLLEQLEQLTGDREQDPYQIMLVDDDEPLADRYALVLRQAGMDVTVFNRASDVIDALADQVPELILMDQYMPECLGMELSKVIRQQDAFQRIPIVYLCSGPINPDTDLGGNVTTLGEVFNGKTASIVFNRVQERSRQPGA